VVVGVFFFVVSHREVRLIIDLRFFLKPDFMFEYALSEIVDFFFVREVPAFFLAFMFA